MEALQLRLPGEPVAGLPRTSSLKTGWQIVIYVGLLFITRFIASLSRGSPGLAVLARRLVRRVEKD
jgi:hypothetical protein